MTWERRAAAARSGAPPPILNPRTPRPRPFSRPPARVVHFFLGHGGAASGGAATVAAPGAHTLPTLRRGAHTPASDPSASPSARKLHENVRAQTSAPLQSHDARWTWGPHAAWRRPRATASRPLSWGASAACARPSRALTATQWWTARAGRRLGSQRSGRLPRRSRARCCGRTARSCCGQVATRRTSSQREASTRRRYHLTPRCKPLRPFLQRLPPTRPPPRHLPLHCQRSASQAARRRLSSKCLEEGGHASRFTTTQQTTGGSLQSSTTSPSAGSRDGEEN